MKIIGITGGVGSGKSQVLHFLKEKYKARIVKLDEVAKQLQQYKGECYDEIVTVFGKEILQEDLELNLVKLADIVFSDGDKLKILNAIVHPKVKSWILEDILKEKDKGTALYVMESALLFEESYDKLCDEVWYIYAEESVRIKRLKETRGYSKARILKIMENQNTEETFCEKCNYKIDNSGLFENTEKQIGERL